MGNKKIIKEAFWLRTISCLAVITTHVVNTTLANYEGNIGQLEQYTLILLRFMAFFGTPAFIFISELLIANSYKNELPNGFFKKRIAFLLLPFISMAILFGLITSNSAREFAIQTTYNLFLGGFHGYFILIIFQFYLLHAFMHKQLKKWSPKMVLPVSLLINILYLGFFNFTEPFQSPLGEHIWQRGYWIPFLGWIFYFALGFYCGVHFEAVKGKLIQYRKPLMSLPLVFLLLLVALVRSDILTEVSSKRVDMIFYTTSVIFVIIVLTTQLKIVPKGILLISRYSFNIFLMHKIFLYYLGPMDFLHPFAYFFFAYAYCFTGSLIVAKALSYVPFSSFIIGRPLPIPSEQYHLNFNVFRRIKWMFFRSEGSNE